MDLQDLLAGINSGQVDVTTSHAVKRVQKPRPSKPREQTDLQKRLRGQAGAVNSGAATAAAGPGPGPATAAATQPAPKPARAAGSGSSAARRATPPPPPTASGNAGTGAGVSLSVGAAAAPAGTAGAAAGAVSEGPVTQRLKKVLDMMKLNRETFTFEELKARIGLDLADDIELQEQLSVHTHITFDSIGQCLRYRPKTPGINNAKDLVNYLRRRTTVEGSSAQASMQGVRVSEIDDSYIGLADDIKQLQAQGIIHVFGTTQAGDEALFAVESMGFVPIAVPVVEQFLSTPLPLAEQDLQDAVKKLGLKSVLASRPVRKLDGGSKDDKRKRKKRKHNFNVANATNAHLPMLFMGEQPDQIDGR